MHGHLCTVILLINHSASAICNSSADEATSSPGIVETGITTVNDCENGRQGN